MNENYQIVCYSKDSAWEVLAEYNSMEANGYQGFYVNQAND